jgi:DNA/RNA endonuclease YhcR with UshA esterase domain
MRTVLLLGCLLLFSSSLAIAEEELKPIGPAEAAKRVDETVLLRMEVKAASIQGNVGFLNSETNHRDAKNFVVFLPPKVLSQFRDSDIADPAKYFRGKTIDVNGKVTLHREKPQIILDGMKAIKIVEKEKPAAKSQ